MERCHVCESEGEDSRLHKCPVCFKLTCEAHVYRMNGRPFCSRGCAVHHFFPDQDDDEE